VREVHSAWESFWARQSGVLAFLVVVIVAVLGFVLDVTLLTEGVPRRDLMLLSNVLIGIIAGWLFYQFARNEKTKREFVRERLRAVADLNHHIRNALQVIRYAGNSKTAQDATQLQLINEAVARIEWALREVLPRYPQGRSSEQGANEQNEADRFPSAVVDDFILRHKEIHPH
jgi:ABC-type nickel/cobalt efflux system permease component RcnA